MNILHECLKNYCKLLTSDCSGKNKKSAYTSCSVRKCQQDDVIASLYKLYMAYSRK